MQEFHIPVGGGLRRNRSHTQTHNRTTKHNTRHDKNDTTNYQTKSHPPPHLTRIEGDAATVRTTPHTWWVIVSVYITHPQAPRYIQRSSP